MNKLSDFDIQEELKKLPDRPGVYLMKDIKNEIIYVGKAISLKKRVRQYFNESKNTLPKVISMVQRINSFEVIITDNELEALVLECNLIKKHRPKYNVLLKDDKNYPYLKITVNEEYPRVFITRRLTKDGAKYFGPYTNTNALRSTLETIKKIFPIRECSKVLEKGKNTRPCLNYHIRKCAGPCTNAVSKEQYGEYIKDIIDLLNGKYNKIIESLNRLMENFAENLDFENAAIYRDKINSIRIILERQKVLSTDDKDRDIIGFAENGVEICIEVFFIRGGKLLGRQSFFFEMQIDSTEEIVSSFIQQYYLDAAFVPGEILVMGEISQKELVEELLEKKRGKKVAIIHPKKGEKSELLKMVTSNAQVSLKNHYEKALEQNEKSKESLCELMKMLNLSQIPERIEAFDISNTGSMDIVAGMVSFVNAQPYKDGYRRYKIKTIESSDDYQSMREVVGRRVKRIMESQNSDRTDLFLVDGGMSHVRVVSKVLDDLGCDIPVYGMVKDDKHRTRALVSENEEFDIFKSLPVLRLITSIQDEVHRYSLTYNKLLRSNRYKKSVLDDIPGIGPKKKKALVKFFGSIEKIKKANMEELQQVPGIDSKLAETINNFFISLRN